MERLTQNQLNKGENMEKLSYEEASKELAQIINQLESGQLSLDEALKLFERGKELILVCNDALNQAKGKLTEIKETLDKLEEV